MAEEILFEREDGIATLTLNRPQRYNALTRRMMREILPEIMGQIQRDEGVKVVIITGAGDAFCSGADVTELEATLSEGLTPADRLAVTGQLMRSVVEPFARLGKPVIGAINGMTAGGGFSLALLCDIRIASERARFSMAFVRRGLIPDLGATWTLPRLVGVARALEIMYTGDIISAQEAERIGLVNRVVPHEQLMPTARELAARLAKGPSVALSLIRKAVYKGLENPLLDQLEVESLAQTLCRQTEDFVEGVRSFLEKREAVFKGR